MVVVDNASSDDSIEDLDNISLPITIIRNSSNCGFAAACNQGAMNSHARYLLFLNPDMILGAASLATAVEFMELSQNANVGACGVQLVDDDQEIIRSCSLFPSPGRFLVQTFGLDRLFPGRFSSKFMTDWDHRETRQVDVVTGAFLLVRRPIFETLGAFDERFFVYLEDVDFLHSVHQRGWLCYYLATAQAYHKQGGCSEQAKASRLVYSLRSRILYSYKNFTWAAATGLLLGTILLEPFTRLIWAGLRGSAHEATETISAFAKLWAEIPGLLWNTTLQKSK